MKFFSSPSGRFIHVLNVAVLALTVSVYYVNLSLFVRSFFFEFVAIRSDAAVITFV